MINIIISLKGLQKIFDRLYIRVCSFKKKYYYEWQVQQVLYCNMKAIGQYKVSFPYNYNRIIHHVEKNYAKRQDIGQTNGKMHLILKIKTSCNSLKSSFPNSLKVKHLTIYLYTALGDLHIYTKHILAHD